MYPCFGTMLIGRRAVNEVAGRKGVRWNDLTSSALLPNERRCVWPRSLAYEANMFRRRRLEVPCLTGGQVSAAQWHVQMASLTEAPPLSSLLIGIDAGHLGRAGRFPWASSASKLADVGPYGWLAL